MKIKIPVDIGKLISDYLEDTLWEDHACLLQDCLVADVKGEIDPIVYTFTKGKDFIIEVSNNIKMKSVIRKERRNG